MPELLSIQSPTHALSGGVTGSRRNAIPVILFPMVVGGGLYVWPEGADESFDPDYAALPTALLLMILMGFFAVRTTRKARLDPSFY